MLKLSLVALIALVGSVGCQVINGVCTDIRKYPFMVSLRNGMGIHICGGTTVADRFILTSAYCVSQRSASELSIQYRTALIKADSKFIIKVKRIIIHEDFDSLKKENDIALLEMVTPIVHGLKTVKIPDAMFELPQDKNGTGVLLGWGKKTDPGKIQNVLQEVGLTIYTNEKCKSMNKAHVTTKLLCAGVDRGAGGACFGDSGGPLLSADSVQLGIVSWANFPCGFRPTIFTKVSHYRDWIDGNLK